MTKTNNCPTVMAKAFGAAPKRLKAVSQTAKYVFVCGDHATCTIGYRREDVFVYDDQLFQQLTAAHRAGEDDQLRLLWGRAKSL